MDITFDFDYLYKKFSPILYKFIAKRLGKNASVVEEIVEDTFVAAWKSYSTFEHKSSYFTWLCRIALNKIADYYHDQINHNSRFIVPLLDSLNLIDTKNLTPEESLTLKELCNSVNDCLNLMPHEKRQLLCFRYWKHYSYQKIAFILGLSERAVEGRLYRAKEEFAAIWTKNAF